VGWRGLLLAVLLALGCGALVLAQAGPSQDAHRLARSLLFAARFETSFDAVAAAQRSKIIGILEAYNQDEAQVAEAVDRIFMPGVQAKLPELLVRCEDVLVRHFTRKELYSLVREEDDEEGRSADAKLPQVQDDIRQAGRIWGRDSCREIFAENRAALANLGLGKAVAGC